MGNVRERAAEMLSIALCDAIHSNIAILSFNAKRWLLLHKNITVEDVVEPPEGGFIATCRLLGLNWHELRKSVMEALDITDIEVPEPEICHLKLVHNSELRYNSSHGSEETIISGGRSPLKRRQH